MKTAKWTLGAVALAMTLFATGSAMAHGRVIVGVGFGFGPYYYPAPYYYPVYYPYPYYPPQPVVIQQPAAPVYAERQDVNEPGFWYYCAAARGYYPYVKECPAGWQKVSPQPGN